MLEANDVRERVRLRRVHECLQSIRPEEAWQISLSFTTCLTVRQRA